MGGLSEGLWELLFSCLFCPKAFFKHGTRHRLRRGGHRNRYTSLWELCFLLAKANHLDTERLWFDTGWTSGTIIEGLWAVDALDMIHVALAGAEVRAEANNVKGVNSYLKIQGYFLLCKKRRELIKYVTHLARGSGNNCFTSFLSSPSNTFLSHSSLDGRTRLSLHKFPINSFTAEGAIGPLPLQQLITQSGVFGRGPQQTRQVTGIYAYLRATSLSSARCVPSKAPTGESPAAVLNPIARGILQLVLMFHQQVLCLIQGQTKANTPSSN
ncbi:uncharacterized protein [Symphalangus syndactylus]|uniref:uncharacterized protein n=1 Tax=Symphalangus syndactylus TaxID=9590 RepID=UPI00300722B8